MGNLPSSCCVESEKKRSLSPQPLAVSKKPQLGKIQTSYQDTDYKIQSQKSLPFFQKKNLPENQHFISAKYENSKQKPKPVNISFSMHFHNYPLSNDKIVFNKNQLQKRRNRRLRSKKIMQEQPLEIDADIAEKQNASHQEEIPVQGELEFIRSQSNNERDLINDDISHDAAIERGKQVSLEYKELISPNNYKASTKSTTQISEMHFA